MTENVNLSSVHVPVYYTDVVRCHTFCGLKQHIVLSFSLESEIEKYMFGAEIKALIRLFPSGNPVEDAPSPACAPRFAAPLLLSSNFVLPQLRLISCIWSSLPHTNTLVITFILCLSLWDNLPITKSFMYCYLQRPCLNMREWFQDVGIKA